MDQSREWLRDHHNAGPGENGPYYEYDECMAFWYCETPAQLAEFRTEWHGDDWVEQLGYASLEEAWEDHEKARAHVEEHIRGEWQVFRTAVARVARFLSERYGVRVRPPGNRELYSTPEWKRLRVDVLAANRTQYGRLQCELCGVECGPGAMPAADVDHIKPVSLYPELALDRANLQVLCELCNLGKSNRYEEDWRSTG